MSFIGEMIEEVVGNNIDSRNEAPMDPPYVQPPWVTRWDDEAGRWIFINEATGERSFEKPVFEEAAEDFGRAEEHVERKWDDGVQDVEDLPEDAARWTGEAVGAVESVPDRVEDDFDRAEDKVERGWDNTVDAVEDAPEDVAGWVGEGVGKVERFGDEVGDFGDSMEASYDQGRDEERYD
ncbi:hypothetical protein M406DRAFT_350577 [Cryphonectria parasitica EP155]|uniref:WW domain-containing protein n=1 Tax=Cryphonectria parasitica (strain ATCC 38755 / EP155) TaxID=660469 RepID=A0A9P4Y6N3_CRYP1|nr:uncharacterized protein M406DRAFT_350577 [Cryphonectria parasitica EP155]KAF3767470.1 hypothetical protein M406DRAFT_350577 [Cryphonectria parasitica EP155]